MGFRLRYGSYTHSENEVEFTIGVEALENEAGGQYAVRKTWNIDGILHADSTAEVVTAFTAMERAYSVWYQDLVLIDDAGSTIHELRNSGSMTGVKITRPPSCPRGSGAELSTYRSYSITATADYPPSGVTNPLRSFTETLSFQGGGPERTVVECVNVPPQEQLLKLFTACRAIQSGSAVGLFSYPLIPAPIFPGKERVRGNPPGNPQKGSPKYRNGQYVDWPISWSYEFISGTPLVGNPNQWPAG